MIRIGSMHDPVTLYKITYTGERVAQWDFQNTAPAFLSIPTVGRCVVEGLGSPQPQGRGSPELQGRGSLELQGRG